MGLVAVLQSIWAFLAALFVIRTLQSSPPLPTAIPLKPRNGPPQTPRRQPPHEYCSLGPNQLGSWRIQKEQFMRNPSLTASPKQRTRPQNLIVTPPAFRLPSLTAVDDWNARVDGGTYQISTLHPRQPLPAVIITPCTPEKKPAFTASLFSSASSTPQPPKIAQPVFVVNPGPEDDDEDIALKRVMEDLECALIQRDKEDVNPFDLSPSTNSSSKDPDPPSFNISHSLQISSSKQSQEDSSACSTPPDDASWDVPWESSPGKAIKVKYATSTPPLSWSLGLGLGSVITQQEQDPFANPENLKSRRTSAPYTDLFDLDMYLEASLGIDLGVCSLEMESENPFEDTFAIEPEPEPVVVVVSPENAAVAVPMNRFVERERERERDVYRPSGYTRSPRFRFSVDENGSPVPLATQDSKRLVDNVRAELAFVDDENGDDDEEGGGGDGDTSEISVPALKARLREACRKSSGAGETAYRDLATSQRKSMPSMLTGSPRAGLVAHSSLAATPLASLIVSQSALRPSSRLLRDITNTMTTSTSSSSTSTLGSVQVASESMVQNPISAVTQKNPIESETRNPIIAPVKSTTTKTRNAMARFGRDIANIVVDDSAGSFSLGGGNATAAGGGGENVTMGSVYSGENTMGSVYSGENTMGSVYSGENTTGSTYGGENTTYSDEAIARAIKARVKQACDNFSKSVWVEECDTVQSWEPVPF
ncbi:hypothetical protein K443DRAFT_95930 [Laccaria amethystina LaAM-08-1]|uniref:Uncharacterized protein n=1 Tax=Laccaria amethystina LaAM-08-1 TaxID=1095629 RepID=A0A0C9XDV6_9AGAR|nr:hypothetical protein K443DRAFT_95930 [Laccaria amethystina LaAM-08-1]